MNTNQFVRNDSQARKLKRQSIALESIRCDLGAGMAGFRSTSPDNDEIDNLVSVVLQSINENPIAALQNQNQDAKALRASKFWTYMLAIPIIFTHGVATRMQFMYGGLYGRDGLNLNNAMAILAVGATAAGRSTAPPLLKRYFNQPYVFFFLNVCTLIGCSLMFLIPVVGGKDNFDDDGNMIGDEAAGPGTIIFFYFTMYIQGLAEVLSGWDVLMRFEMRMWTPEAQQLAFRCSFVAIALGSATAFISSAWLFELHGLYGCAWLGVSAGILNVALPAFYLGRRWTKYVEWRESGNKKRSMASRRSQPLMKMLKVDGFDRQSTLFGSTRKLKFVPDPDLMNSGQFSMDESSSSLQFTSEREFKKHDIDYVAPRNYFEFQSQLQFQTSERIVNNFRKICRKTGDFMQEHMNKLTNADILAAFDPALLLRESTHIDWPKPLSLQIARMKWFCIMSLALGSTMISSQFAVYCLYLVDVWKVSAVFAGTSMAIGEISGMLTLLVSIYLEKRQAENNEEEINTHGSVLVTSTIEQKKDERTGWQNLIDQPSLIFQVPSMFTVTCILAVIPLSVLSFVRPDRSGLSQEDYEDLPSEIGGVGTWPVGLWCALTSGVTIGIVNCLMHATIVEMTALLLPEDLFESALATGYSLRRITNLSVCLISTLLYSANRYSVYLMVMLVFLLFVPVSLYVLALDVKCMPWQKREVIFGKSLAVILNEVQEDVEVDSSYGSSVDKSYGSSVDKSNGLGASGALGSLEEDDEDDSENLYRDKSNGSGADTSAAFGVVHNGKSATLGVVQSNGKSAISGVVQSNGTNASGGLEALDGDGAEEDSSEYERE